jgi:hypothetical protein
MLDKVSLSLEKGEEGEGGGWTSCYGGQDEILFSYVSIYLQAGHLPLGLRRGGGGQGVEKKEKSSRKVEEKT